MYKMEGNFYLNSRITVVFSEECKKLYWVVSISRDIMMLFEERW
jgi:hypothetical protein